MAGPLAILMLANVGSEESVTTSTGVPLLFSTCSKTSVVSFRMCIGIALHSVSSFQHSTNVCAARAATAIRLSAASTAVIRTTNGVWAVSAILAPRLVCALPRVHGTYSVNRTECGRLKNRSLPAAHMRLKNPETLHCRGARVMWGIKDTIFARRHAPTIPLHLRSLAATNLLPIYYPPRVHLETEVATCLRRPISG